ncbi:MAG: anti-sigma factor family protein [Gemmataceae bacterium]
MTQLKPLVDDERAELIAYLDGELDVHSARRMEAKLNTDPAIRAEAESLKRTWELLDFLPKSEPSPTFTQRTMQRVTAVQSRTTVIRPGFARRPWALGVGWAAAVLLAGAAGFAAMARWQPKEVNDDQLVRELRIIENKRLYEDAEEMEFLRQLDDPDLFGDDLDT